MNLEPGAAERGWQATELKAAAAATCRFHTSVLPNFPEILLHLRVYMLQSMACSWFFPCGFEQQRGKYGRRNNTYLHRNKMCRCICTGKVPRSSSLKFVVRNTMVSSPSLSNHHIAYSERSRISTQAIKLLEKTIKRSNY